MEAPSIINGWRNSNNPTYLTSFALLDSQSLHDLDDLVADFRRHVRFHRISRRHGGGKGAIGACPRVLLDLLDGEAFGGIENEHVPDQVLTVSGHEEGNAESTAEHAIPQRLQGAGVKG